ncbi:T7SS_mycosin, type VII secretion-associated serine protease mycosin [uncultured Caudovirales phage]|uniref:T7SS_mycosin, type VII secretion-associated serine protease mycosin n=1 Tax=uncultured Caudovirales phage TaxID=2100421 RepID=A0A6J5RRB1_9CAUD|nr:T7SS_mycosin, type VII secretion-associated serine protease mycosin [uncultured Caudovirales phage]CAB4190126.1 T7SS_mycosin, type VII secretion-associated serine protease mycosin [uncultured Caudovirales phage]CAB4194364.1 T7SS_mycosin, type VII secretion-associated serine protease mycosin [uncultured Caudovirales phage]
MNKIFSLVLSFILFGTCFVTPAQAAAKRYSVKYTWSAAQTQGWALDRINQGYLNKLDGKYPKNREYGSGITVYVIDTGIGFNDCNGHGSFVSSLIKSPEWGISQGVSIVSVKALGCDGSGSVSDVISAINWVKSNANPSTSIVNMSLGGPSDASINSAANVLGNLMPVVVAAGNSATNACSLSPAGAANVITVAGLDPWHYRSMFSNYGPCVDIWAPATNIDGMTKDGVHKQESGTSAAAPLVSAAIAWIADRDNVTTAQAYQTILRESSDVQVINGYTTSKPFLLWLRDEPNPWYRY